MKVFEIDGERFSTLDEFYDEIERALDLPKWFGRNLNALNDVLRGGIGTPVEGEGFVLRWKSHEISKQRLGYAETVRVLEKRLGNCHPDNRTSVRDQLDAAKQRQGTTVFDWLVDIIRSHVEDGSESEDKVVLELD